MISNKKTFFLGVFIFFIPFFGIPGSWKTAFIIISSIFLVLLSVKIPIPKKPSKPRLKREKNTISQSTQVAEADDIVISPIKNPDSSSQR